MTLHVIGFVHTRFDDAAFSHCAYTAKVVRWVEMMSALGEQVVVYWGGDAPAREYGQVEFVSLMSDEEQARMFGDDLRATILYLDWNPDTPHWRMLNHRAAAGMYSRWEDGDVACVLSGSNHDGLINEWERATFVEPWIGYAGISSRTSAKCFESSAWRHTMYGQYRIEDGNPLDTVIPNFYRPTDFHMGEDEGYLLFVGRMIRRKGVVEAIEIARRMGRQLVLAGQGARVVEGDLVTDDGTPIDTSGVDVKYHGVVGPDVRAELYAHASATLVPTIYIEPFGGVFVEAMLSGVQPACRNWGAFVEYVDERARFDDVGDAVEVVDWAISRRGSGVRDAAIEQFGVDSCAKRYGQWLGRVRDTMSA